MGERSSSLQIEPIAASTPIAKASAPRIRVTFQTSFLRANLSRADIATTPTRAAETIAADIVVESKNEKAVVNSDLEKSSVVKMPPTAAGIYAR